MNDYQIRFLQQYVLGQKVRINDSQEVIKKCVELADRDMLSGGRFICSRFKKQTNKERVQYILNKLEEEHYVYTNLNKIEICNDIFWECDKTESTTVKGKQRDYKPFGFVQKLVNMTFKYLYIYKDHIGKEIDFSKCECPVDSVVIHKLGRKEKWTNITCKDYEEIKESINEKLADKRYYPLQEEIGGLAFDDNWINDDQVITV